MPFPLTPRAALTAAAPTIALLALCLAASAPAARADYSSTILHTFTNVSGDGLEPYGETTLAADGTIYGTTVEGGVNTNGIVYSISPAGKFSLLHAFNTSSTDGIGPYATVTLGSDGFLYGTTLIGGASNDGLIFKVGADGTGYQVLHNFAGGSDGVQPYGAVIFGHDGKLYGTAQGDGNSNSTAPNGVIYSLSTDGSNYLVQYRFTGSNYATSGAEPYCTLTPAASASSSLMYGTTSQGGSDGYGTIFSFTPGTTDGSGSLSILHTFGVGVTDDGEQPQFGQLQLDSAGDLLGDTTGGGTDQLGTVFKLAPNGTETILYNFTGNNDGWVPQGGVTLASDGNCYGTTTKGGADYDGVVYRVNPAATSASGSNFTVVYTFGDNAGDGETPYARPIEDSSGSLLGTASYGGEYNGSSAYGTVYKLAAGLPTANGVQLSSVDLSPATTPGGSTTTASRAYLTGNAAANTVVTITSSNTSVAKITTTPVTIKTGSSSHVFTIATSSVKTATNVTITATANGVSKSATLTVVPGLSSVTLSPASVTGGTTTTASRAYLSGNAASDTSVTITSSNPSVAKITTTPVTIKTGSSSHVFTIQTSAVKSSTTVTITAAADGISKSATLTVTP